MSRTKGLVALAALLAVVVLLPAMTAFAQDGVPSGLEDVRMAIAVGSALAMAIASSACGLAQGRAVAAACESVARNPGAADKIRGSLIIGLVLIESLAIYTLLIGLVLFFFGWNA